MTDVATSNKAKAVTEQLYRAHGANYVTNDKWKIVQTQSKSEVGRIYRFKLLLS